MSISLKRNEEIIKKSINDPIFFIKTFCKIQHPIRGVIPFKLHPYQEQLILTTVEHPYVIVNKSRQLGVSTVSAAFCLWYTMFHHTKNILVIATKRDVAKNFVDKCRFMYDNLPPAFRQFAPLAANNKQEIIFEHTTSKIKAIGTSEDAGRSEAVSWLFVDEAAFVDGMDAIWTSLWPILACVTGDTLILTNEGYKKIQTIIDHNDITGELVEFNSDLKVFGKDGLEDISHTFISKKSETFVIRTRRGMELEVTPDHPLYSIKKNDEMPQMNRSYNLSVGDFLRVDHSMNVFGNKHNDVLTKDMSYMIGGYIAEGWMDGRNKRDSIYICNTDDDFRNVFLNNKIIKNFHVQGSRKERLLCCSVDLVRYFQDMGIDEKWNCEFKEVPWKIMESSKENMSSFLSGLFDGDGRISERSINLTSTSKKLIQQVQILLLNYGILSNVSKTDAEKSMASWKKNKRVLPNGNDIQSIRDSYRLDIPTSQFSKFHESIGFRIKRKSEKLVKLISEIDQNDDKLFRIPSSVVKNKIKKIMKYYNVSGRFLRNNGVRTDKPFDGKTDRNVNTAWMRRFEKIIRDISKSDCFPEEFELFFKEFSSYDCYWDDIVSIERSENITYDLTVPGTHSFLQNGILGSNTGGRCMLLSTPNGTGNIFYEIYAKAKAQENPFVAVDLPWYSDPSRDEEWYKKQISAFGQKRFDQEYGLSFQSQDNAFLPEDVFDFVKSTIKNPVENWRHSGKLWVWEKPIPHEEYAIGADVSSGHSDDYSTLQVIRAKTNEQVAEFHAKVDTSDFAQILCDIGNEYNTAVLCIERNNLGDSVLKRIRDYVTYQKLMFTDSFGNPVVTNSYDGFNASGIKAGFNMQTKTRLNVLNTVLEGLASQQYKIRSERLLNEFRTFIIRAGKAEHTKSKNDDLIIAYALSVWTREYCLKQLAAGLEYQESFLRSISRDFVSTSQLNPETTGFNFYGTPDKIKAYSQESLGIYSPFGPMESSNHNGFLESGRPKYNKKLGRVVSRRVTDPFGE